MPGSNEQLRVAIQVAKRPRLETELGRAESIKDTDICHAAPGVLCVLLQEAQRGGINASRQAVLEESLPERKAWTSSLSSSTHGCTRGRSTPANSAMAKRWQASGAVGGSAGLRIRACRLRVFSARVTGPCRWSGR
jgi:hypothetical protein